MTPNHLLDRVGLVSARLSAGLSGRMSVIAEWELAAISESKAVLAHQMLPTLSQSPVSPGKQRGGTGLDIWIPSTGAFLTSTLELSLGFTSLSCCQSGKEGT